VRNAILHRGIEAGPGERGAGFRAPAGHLRGGRRGVEALDREAIVELQRLAGNAAVAQRMIGQRRDGRVIMGVDRIKVDANPSAPPDGLAGIRKLKRGAGILGYTVRSIAEWAPILRVEAPTQDAEGWTAKARPINYVPEPEFTEYWPTQGRQKLAERTYLDIAPEWETKLHGGEDEHVSDSTHAWEISWKKAAEIINALSKEPGPTQPTGDAAVKDVWDRYRRALPADDMRPAGKMPTDQAQKDIFSTDRGTLFRWLFETTVVRDTRGYHEPKTKPTGVGDDTVSTLDDGTSKLPGPASADLISEVRAKWKPGKDIIGS
jgi:hypothetical protein